ncbi:type II toxin-antitoxin system Phd/YefM family antitoxin [uncultured Granulicatella sp.]|uniref:type II toxin-antitoxin system Phd/YefM family antitoxin n=1 Tax=uncultured Granulicatella sp. TaxID=316089 RepID=UPI0026344BB5|nr:type II toxin-antitoxin system Phd/YefM family antitoxin [uncultured Granulicatella sp.]
MKIIPMRDLKNTVEVERQCKEEQGPIFVTKNGYGRLVVMDIEYYESTIQKMEEARLLIEALEDVKEGRVLDGKEALLKLREKYGI